MVILLNENDILKMQQLEDEMLDDIQYGNFYTKVIKETFGEENLLPEEIYTISKEIENMPINEAKDPDGPTLISASLGIAKQQAMKMLQDPKKVSVMFRSLRNKLEECEDKQRRQKAEKKGFLAMVIYTIKKALNWMLKTFADLKDYVIDSATDRPMGAAQAKRDFKWIQKHNERFLDNNTDWYNWQPKQQQMDF